jgi:predicted DNA-binding transcriptional regulator AlpA
MNGVAEPVSPPATVPRKKSKPLLPVRGVCSLVGMNEDEVLGLIQSGAIRWAFDVSLARRRQRRKHLRILPAAVVDYIKGQTCGLKWPDVFALLLPDAPTIRAHEVSRLLNISGDQVYRLIDGGQIVACSARRRGPAGSARIPVASLVRFFQKRRFP